MVLGLRLDGISRSVILRETFKHGDMLGIVLAQEIGEGLVVDWGFGHGLGGG
jgi:hypothetical protein